MEIKRYSPKELIKYQNNPLKHPKEQIDKIANSIKEYGFLIPIVIDENKIIVSGHGRLEAALKLELKEIPCIEAIHLTKGQIKAFRIADNKVREGSIWDEESLRREFEELDKLGLTLEETGFSLDELENIFPRDMKKLDSLEEDVVPEPREKPFSKLGDMWILGNHRLLCGDSTSQEDVKKLIGDERMDLMITDPPYNINYESENGLKIKNDNMESAKFYEFLLKFYENANSSLKEGAPFYVFYADLEAINFRKALEEAKLKLSQTLIWVKNGFNLSRQDYNWKHEPCLYGWKPGAGHYFIKDFTQSTVLEKELKNYKGLKKEELLKEIERLEREKDEYSTVIRENKPLRNDVHPTMKPLKLIGKLMVNSSKPGDKVIDFFGGSGSTLIAAEELGRKARLIEYDPIYVDVIVKRYMQLEERGAVMLVRKGKTYSYKNAEEMECRIVKTMYH